MALKYTKLTTPSDLGSGTWLGAAWSRNSKYLAIGSDNNPSGRLYRRDGNAFTRLTLSPAPGVNARIREWERKDRFFAFSSRASGSGFTLWKNYGDDTFGNIATTNMDQRPPVGRAHSWADNEDILLCATDAAPYVWAYTYDSSDFFTRIALNFDINPPDRGFELKLSPDGNFLAMTSITNPVFLIYRVLRNSPTSWTLVRVLADNFATGLGVSWHPSSKYVAFGGSGAGQPFVYKLVSPNIFSRMPELPGAGNSTQMYVGWSADGRYLFTTTATAAQRDLTWSFKQSTETFTLLDPPADRPNAYGSNFSPSVDGLFMSYNGSSGASPYLVNYRLGDASARVGFGRLASAAQVDVQKIGVATFLQVGMSSLRTLVQVDNTVEPPVVYDSPWSSVVIALLPEVPAISSMVLPRPAIATSFRSMSTALRSSAEMSGAMAVGFKSLFSSALASRDPAPVISASFSRLFSSAMVASPVDIDFTVGFGTLTSESEVSKPSMSGSIATGFLSLYSASEAYTPIVLNFAPGFAALETELIGSSPALVYVETGFLPLASAAEVAVPVVGVVDVGFEALQSDGFVAVPDVARMAQSFQSLASEGEVNVPNVGRVSGSFAALVNEGFVMVPTVTRITLGFKALESAADIMVPTAVLMSPSFAALESDSRVVAVSGFDMRNSFGKLQTRIVASPPIKLNGNFTLPFMQARGVAALDSLVNGAFTLPFAEVSGRFELTIAARGDWELPGIEAEGEAVVVYMILGEASLPLPVVDAAAFSYMEASGAAVLPYIEVIGRGEGKGGRTAFGNTPRLTGANNPQAMLHVGGGIYLNFDDLTIG